MESEIGFDSSRLWKIQNLNRRASCLSFFQTYTLKVAKTVHFRPLQSQYRKKKNNTIYSLFLLEELWGKFLVNFSTHRKIFLFFFYFYYAKLNFSAVFDWLVRLFWVTLPAKNVFRRSRDLQNRKNYIIAA